MHNSTHPYLAGSDSNRSAARVTRRNRNPDPDPVQASFLEPCSAAWTLGPTAPRLPVLDPLAAARVLALVDVRGVLAGAAVDVVEVAAREGVDLVVARSGVDAVVAGVGPQLVVARAAVEDVA